MDFPQGLVSAPCWPAPCSSLWETIVPLARRPPNSDTGKVPANPKDEILKGSQETGAGFLRGCWEDARFGPVLGKLVAGGGWVSGLG